MVAKDLGKSHETLPGKYLRWATLSLLNFRYLLNKLHFSSNQSIHSTKEVYAFLKMTVTLSFATVDVFTDVRFAGNPLAIVNIPRGIFLPQETKQKIAREFNFSETVFLHEQDGSESGRKVDIFTINEELPFAGMPF